VEKIKGRTWGEYSSMDILKQKRLADKIYRPLITPNTSAIPAERTLRATFAALPNTPPKDCNHHRHYISSPDHTFIGELKSKKQGRDFISSLLLY
jgi:hypothetical protein